MNVITVKVIGDVTPETKAKLAKLMADKEKRMKDIIDNYNKK